MLKKDGELRAEFESIAPVTLLGEQLTCSFVRAANLARRLGIPAAGGFAAKRLAHGRVDLIYSNTIENWAALEHLIPLGQPVITHVHELEYWISCKTGLETFSRIQRATRFFIAASEAVRRNLVDNHHVPESMTKVVYEFIPADGTGAKERRVASLGIRQALGIPSNATIVGGAGSTDWRKGTDLFVQLASAVHRQSPQPPVYFLWVGGENQGPSFDLLWHDVRRLGIERYIRFAGALPNALDYFACFDMLALVSREDPFPLVMLECASLRKPILCFDGSGGAVEFVDDSCGYVVPYLDINEMAKKVLLLHQSPEICLSMGACASQKVQSDHDVDIVAPRVFDIMENFLQGAG